MRPAKSYLLFALLPAALSPDHASAESVSILPSDDTALFESSPEDDFNFGGQRDIPIGTTGFPNGSARSRGLFRFDVAAALPAGSTINGGTFSLTVERTPPGGPSSTFELRRMLVPWTEGTKNNPERPGGRLAGAGEPTWNHRLADPTSPTPWGTSGGQAGTDYSTIASASRLVSGTATYQWTLNAAGVADLQAMLDTPASNFGWMLITASEGTPKTGRRFYTKETLTDLPQRQGPPPELNIDFSPPASLLPPEVTQFSFDGSNITLGFFATGGISYEVQTSASLDEAGWTTIESFQPTVDGPLSSTLPSSAQARTFVRILASDDE